MFKENEIDHHIGKCIFITIEIKNSKMTQFIINYDKYITHLLCKKKHKLNAIIHTDTN